MVIFEKAPAKINLALDVLGKRTDGYHEVKMVMTMIDLADRITITERDDEAIFLHSTSGYIPLDQRNLAYQSAQLMKDTYRIHRGINIFIDKKIPVAAGLAGGSSNAAAVMRGLNRLWNLQLPLKEIVALGAAIGSDVPYCVLQGTALATGKGEQVIPLPPVPPCWVVLAKPAIRVPTAEIYGALDMEDMDEHPDIAGMIEAIKKKDYQGMIHRLGNVLEKVTFQKYPQVAYLKHQMQRFGADAVCMSGTGPTVYALLDKKARVYRLFHGLKGFCREVYMVRILTQPANHEETC